MELLHQGVLERAEDAPERTAVVDPDGGRVQYGQLIARSSQIARALQTLGFEAGDRAAVLVPKTSVGVSALVAVLQADGIYLPLDPSAPASHTAKSVRRAEPSAVLFSGETEKTAADLRQVLAGGEEIDWIRLDEAPDGGAQVRASVEREEIAAQSSEPPATGIDLDDPAYLMFTSGSTGTPKGVLVSHRNASHFVDWGVEYFGFSKEDRHSGHPPLHFDLSVFDIFATLASGGELHPISPDLNTFPNKLAQLIRDRELTQWFSVPAALKLMARFEVVEEQDFPSLRRVLWCGEVLPTPVLRYWMERVPQAEFTNLYGPTETTVASSYYTVPEVPSDGQADVPIGRACEGEELLVLDEEMERVEAGVVGDLYIGGEGVTLGYWREPEKTDEAFLPAPSFADYGGRIYRTGDLASRDDQELYHFHGREDRQVKSRGHRIELDEIEVALHALPIIEDAAVVAVESDGFEGKRICCAYVCPPDSTYESHEVRRELSDHLPSYMLPADWRQHEGLPRNKNGKIDRVRVSEWFSEDGDHD